MGWNSQVILASLVIIEGPDDGLFVYNGTPAAGNLIASIAPSAGTDSFGNNYDQGVACYEAHHPTASSAAVLNEGFLQLLDDEGNLNGQLATAGALNAGLQITGENNAGSSAVTSNLYLANPAQTAGSVVTDSVIAAQGPSSGGGTAEVWHTPTLNDSWTGLRYAMMPFGVSTNMVWLNGSLTAGSTFADGTTILTLPSAYRPTSTQNAPLTTNNTLATAGDQSPHLTISTGGLVKCFGVRAAGDILGLNSGYPLD